MNVRHLGRAEVIRRLEREVDGPEQWLGQLGNSAWQVLMSRGYC